MRQLFVYTIGVLLLLLTASCNEDTSSADVEIETLGVFVENTGTSDLILRQAIVTFCYEGTGCIEGNVSNFTLPADAGAPLELGISDTSLETTGVIVTFQAVTGQGSLEVQLGSPVASGDFEQAEIRKVSEFGAGENVTVTYGETGL